MSGRVVGAPREPAALDEVVMRLMTFVVAAP